MSEFVLEITAGNRRRARIIATWPEDVPELGVTKGQAVNLSTMQKIWFTAKMEFANDDTQAVIKKDTTLSGVDDITYGTGATANYAYFDIVEADTDDFLAISRAVKLKACELKVKSASSEPWTVAQGIVKIHPTAQRSST